MSIRYGQYQLANDSRARSVVEAAMMNAALQVMNESPDTPNHGNRKALAVTMYTPDSGNRSLYIEMMAWRVAMNPTIQGKVVDANGGVNSGNLDDSDVDFVVAEHWNTISNSDLMALAGV